MLYNKENMEDKWYEHENGYSAVLYGESSMSVYHYNEPVMHTRFRGVNTESEVMELLAKMPEFCRK